MGSGLLVIYVLIENLYGSPPSVADLWDYADDYNMDNPVLGDNNYQFFSALEADNYIPSVSLIKWDGTLLVKDNIDQVNAQINAALPPGGGPTGW